jgi:hypothetical protein
MLPIVQDSSAIAILHDCKLAMSVLCYVVERDEGGAMSRTTHLHVDHVVRHNAVGWPLTDQVNAFTASLGIYPVIAAGAAGRPGRLGRDRLWALVSGGGAVFVNGLLRAGPQPR